LDEAKPAFSNNPTTDDWTYAGLQTERRPHRNIPGEEHMAIQMTEAVSSSPHLAEKGAVDRLFSKISWRILPFLVLCYVIAFLDRINIGYAQLHMKQTLTFSDATYGFGAGIFFIGYFLFEVPSNLLLERIGVRKTLLRIMFTWGIVATAMAFVQTPMQFYIARFLLGLLEAGFFPGIILYLTYWYPSARRGQIIAMFLAATAIASVIAGPLSGATLKYLNGFEGFHGWQWLFISQGIPATILGVLAYLYLQDKPEDARWLTAEEKSALRFQLDHDDKDVESAHHSGFFRCWEIRRFTAWRSLISCCWERRTRWCSGSPP